jgi:hypothetical protein
MVCGWLSRGIAAAVDRRTVEAEAFDHTTEQGASLDHSSLRHGPMYAHKHVSSGAARQTSRASESAGIAGSVQYVRVKKMVDGPIRRGRQHGVYRHHTGFLSAAISQWRRAVP